MSTLNSHGSLQSVPANGAAEEQRLVVHGVEESTLELSQPRVRLPPEPSDPLDPLGVPSQYPALALELRSGVRREGGEQVRVLFQKVIGVFIRAGNGLSEVAHAVPLHCCVTASPC